MQWRKKSNKWRYIDLRQTSNDSRIIRGGTERMMTFWARLGPTNLQKRK